MAKGQIVHMEFPASDAARAIGFWQGLFGWQFGEPMSEEMDYRMAQTGEEVGAAIWTSGDAGRPNFYFDTDDIDASIAKVKELGGKTEGKMPIPHVGWFAHCEDPDGIAFSLFQSDESVTG
jgi:predicted enzyme related to lactoylglutathione lyase